MFGVELICVKKNLETKFWSKKSWKQNFSWKIWVTKFLSPKNSSVLVGPKKLLTFQMIEDRFNPQGCGGVIYLLP